MPLEENTDDEPKNSVKLPSHEQMQQMERDSHMANFRTDLDILNGQLENVSLQQISEAKMKLNSLYGEGTDNDDVIEDWILGLSTLGLLKEVNNREDMIQKLASKPDNLIAFSKMANSDFPSGLEKPLPQDFCTALNNATWRMAMAKHPSAIEKFEAKSAEHDKAQAQLIRNSL